MKTPSKEIAKLMKEAGFHLIRMNKHPIWRHECGAQVSSPLTPSSSRHLQYLKRDIKQALARSTIQ